jgi:hypothetical protein
MVDDRIVKCGECDGEARLVSGKVVYPHREDLGNKRFWMCEKCGAYVGCHKVSDGTLPLGSPAGRETRSLRAKVHGIIDPPWQSRKVQRKAVYYWIAQKLGISTDDCHIGMFDAETCKKVLGFLEQGWAKEAAKLHNDHVRRTRKIGKVEYLSKKRQMEEEG